MVVNRENFHAEKQVTIRRQFESNDEITMEMKSDSRLSLRPLSLSNISNSSVPPSKSTTEMSEYMKVDVKTMKYFYRSPIIRKGLSKLRLPYIHNVNH